MLERRHGLVAILALAVLLRVAVAFYLGDIVDAPPLLTDQRSYHALGVSLLAGRGYSFQTAWYPFTAPNTPTAHWSFLYPAWVAGVYAVLGPHPLAVRLAQAILGGVLLPWLAYRLAAEMLRRMAGESAAEESVAQYLSASQAHPWPVVDVPLLAPLLAAFVAAIYPYFILYAATLMTETFFICAVLWSLERSLKLEKLLRQPPALGRSIERPYIADSRLRPLTGPIVGLGMSLGLAALLRQSVLPWAAVLALILAWRGWRAGRARPAALALLGVAVLVAACIAPFTLRNYRVYQQFLLLNSNAGYAMYSAQHPMHGVNFREFDAAPLPPGVADKSEPEMDRELMRLGVQFVLADPVRYVLLSLSRLRAFFEFWPTPDTTLLHNIGRVASFGLCLPFMLYGLVRAIRQARPTNELLIVFLFMALYTAQHVLTWAMVRYRLPVDAVLVVFAAYGLRDLYVRYAVIEPDLYRSLITDN